MARIRDIQVLDAIERCNQARTMRGEHLLHQRQQCGQYVIGLKAAPGDARFEKLDKRRLVLLAHPVTSALASISSACSLSFRTSRIFILSSLAASFSNWASSSNWRLRSSAAISGMSSSS